MPDDTPTTEHVRHRYTHSGPSWTTCAGERAAFDRWLAAHDEQVRQEAAAAERAKIAAAIEVARDQGAEDALRDAGRLCHNGAPDPYQEWYDRGVGQWLTNLADDIRDSIGDGLTLASHPTAQPDPETRP